MIWVINSEGNTFIPYKQDTYNGSENVEKFMTETAIPLINKITAKIWVDCQVFNSQSELFASVRTAIKLILVVLGVFLLIVLINRKLETLYSLFAAVLVMLWLVCCVSAMYIFFKEFKYVDFDKRIIDSIH